MKNMLNKFTSEFAVIGFFQTVLTPATPKTNTLNSAVNSAVKHCGKSAVIRLTITVQSRATHRIDGYRSAVVFAVIYRLKAHCSSYHFLISCNT